MQDETRNRSYTLDQWCALRGVSRPTFYRLLRDGEIKTFKIRARRYVSAEADREFLARKQEEAS